MCRYHIIILKSLRLSEISWVYLSLSYRYTCMTFILHNCENTCLHVLDMELWKALPRVCMNHVRHLFSLSTCMVCCSSSSNVWRTRLCSRCWWFATCPRRKPWWLWTVSLTSATMTWSPWGVGLVRTLEMRSGHCWKDSTMGTVDDPYQREDVDFWVCVNPACDETLVPLSRDIPDQCWSKGNLIRNRRQHSSRLCRDQM